jgi:two-component system sensor histidine kinase/response regulator
MNEPKPKVLLVDDVEANLVALEGILGRMPCELVRASSGNEALRLLLKQDFAVMLLDVQMPEMDGYEVAQHARDNPHTRNVPVIFVTATHETEESVLRGYDAGAFDLLFKPIDPYVLRSKVQVFLALYLGRQRLQAEIEAHKRTMAEVEAFNYSVSHDLRAPLRPLDGFSEVLLEDYADKLDDRGRDYLTRIRAAAQRMAQLIDDLLELSRVSRADLRRQQLDLSALVGAIVADIRADEAAGEREVVCAPGLQVSADARLLRIALENLLRNAWKFTGRQAQPRIEFGCTRAGEELTYFVRDNGVGFDPTYASKLFQPFQRLHTAEFAGTGIGLAIVDRIIHRHEGRIWGESTPGQGATFFFTLSTR